MEKQIYEKETKSKIYNTAVRPIMTYALETRAEANNNRNLEENEMKVLRKIAGKIKMDRIK